MIRIGNLVRVHMARVYGKNSMIRIGDLVRGHYIGHKIGVVTKIDDVAEMAFVQYAETNKCWEPLANLRKVIR